jgi:hypothetical protein
MRAWIVFLLIGIRQALEVGVNVREKAEKQGNIFLYGTTFND